jgi:hypothetical protein
MIPWLLAAEAGAKIWSGFLGSKAAKRQAQNQALGADIQRNVIRSNLFQQGIRGYGDALQASQRAGGFGPGAFNSSFGNLAADLRTAQYNWQQQRAQAASAMGAARLSLLTTAADAALGFAKGHRADKRLAKMERDINSLLDRYGGVL